MTDNPIRRMHSLIQNAVRIGEWVTDAEREDQPIREYYHGYRPGDRVIVTTFGNTEPVNYGHITDVRRGCGHDCQQHCPLVTVKIEGRTPADRPDQTCHANGTYRFPLPQIQHAD